MAVSFKEILYLIIVACLALSFNFFAISVGQHTYWIMLAALMCSLLLLQDNFKFHLYSILITGFLAAIFVSLKVSYFAVLPALAVYLAFITFIAMFVGQRYLAWFLPSFIINVCVLLSVLYPAVNEKIYIGNYLFANNIARGFFIAEGALIAWIPQVLLWGNIFRRANKIIYNDFYGEIIAVLGLFRQLNKTIFACFLDPAYQENIYLFERRIHVFKNKIIESTLQLRNLLQTKYISNKTEFVYAVNHLDLLFDVVLQYAQLRRRVTDNTIFAVCVAELTAVQDEIEKLLSDMIATFPHKKYHLRADNLFEAIKRFEEIYQNVLRVTSREPLVFLLFIASLQDVCKELAAFYTALLAIRQDDKYGNQQNHR